LSQGDLRRSTSGKIQRSDDREKLSSGAVFSAVCQINQLQFAWSLPRKLKLNWIKCRPITDDVVKMGLEQENSRTEDRFHFTS
jgi:hypothetical protein